MQRKLSLIKPLRQNRSRVKNRLIENIKKLETALKEAKKENKDQIKKDIEHQCERLKAFEQTEVASDLEKNTAEPIATKDAEKPHV